MRYQKWGQHGDKIVCYSQQKSKPYLVKDENCNQRKIWADEVEDIVIKAVFEFANNYQPSKTESLAPDNTISLLYEQKKNLNQKLKRLYNLYSDSEDDVLLETINEVKKQLNNINKQIELDTQNSIILSRRKERTEILNTVNELWNNLDIKQKKNIMRKLINKIEINDNNIHVDFSI